jgi:hypothetical protein
MKRKYHLVFFALLSIIFLITCSKHSKQNNPQSQDPFFVDIPATESYAEPWSDDDLGINLVQQADNSIVDQWSKQTNVVWYLYMQPGVYKMYLNVMLSQYDSSNFTLTVSLADSVANKNSSDPFKTKSKQFGVHGTDEFFNTFIDSVNFSIVGFYRFELKPNYKTAPSYATMKSLRFTSSLSPPGVRFAKYLSSPSVHLYFYPANGVNYNCDWLYGEITVPAGYDLENTYYECIGVDMGYFGMQVNSSTERRIIFSIWNSFNSNIDQNVPDSLQVKLLDSGTNIFYSRFNNEGSGGHTHLVYPWKAGATVKFLMNARLMQDNSVVYSAWFMDDPTLDWQYMASFKSPDNQKLFDAEFYSFVENFGSSNGQQIRKGYYSNMWGKISGQTTWVSLSQAYMSYTDGLPDGRSDYAGGIDETTRTRFYLQSGGYLNPVFNASPLLPPGTIPPQVDTVTLRMRVDKAIAK